MLETFIHGELQKSLPYQQHDFRLYHWRNERQKEIDILAESATRLVGIEIKAASALCGQKTNVNNPHLKLGVNS